MYTPREGNVWYDHDHFEVVHKCKSSVQGNRKADHGHTIRNMYTTFSNEYMMEKVIRCRQLNGRTLLE